MQFDESKQLASVLGFSFAPAENLDYNEAFKILFFDEGPNLLNV